MFLRNYSALTGLVMSTEARRNIGNKGLKGKPNRNVRTTAANIPSNITASVDWRNVAGYVQPIRDQGNCGSFF